MLLLIRANFRFLFGKYSIQIHLMLLLILVKTSCINARWHSNTSHVIVNLKMPIAIMADDDNSNTSHVIVNRVPQAGHELNWEFKYISCYC